MSTPYADLIGRDTIGRYDLSTLFRDGGVFGTLVGDLARPWHESAVTHVLGPEALGFVLAGAVAHELGAGAVPVRKGGRLPYTDDRVVRRDFVDYTGEDKVLELQVDALTDRDRVLIVDDWIETGAQMRAVAALVAMLSSQVVGIATVGAEQKVLDTLPDGVPVHALIVE